MRALPWALTFRDMAQHRLRALLSAMAVALGVMMVVAADVTGEAITSAGERMEASQSTAGILGAQLESLLGTVGLVILTVAGFLTFNAFAMSVTQRRQQIGVLRSLGMTRRQVMHTVLAEALLTGGAGTLLGLLAGPLLGRGLVVLLGETAHISYGKSAPSPGNVLLACALGMGVSVLSMICPAYRATRITPLEALHDRGAPSPRTRSLPRLPLPLRGIEKRAWLLGLLGIAALAIYLAVDPPARSPALAANARTSPPGILVGALSLCWLGCLLATVPPLIDGLGRRARAPLSRLWGAIGRLVADNLRRDRGRVLLTVLTLAVSVMMIVSIVGSLTLMTRLMLSYYTRAQIPPRWALFPIGWSGELASWQTVSELDLFQIGVSDALYEEIVDAFGGRAEVVRVRAGIVLGLDVVPGSMSFYLDARQMQRLALFDFYEGDWETALPIMESGCGVLITPGLARAHGVWLGDALSVPGPDGPVACTVAGLGLSANFGASLVGSGAAGSFGLPPDPFGLFLQPLPGVDPAHFEADLRAFVQGHPRLSIFDLREAGDFMEAMIDGMLAMLNGPLLLSIGAAALGVVNTTAMSVAERRRELGLLRAVGATRRQARGAVLGEAVLVGFLGGALGWIAGGGLVAIQVLAGDHSTWGLRDLQLGPLLWQVARPSLLNGLFSALATPLICAGAAWLPARSILRSSAWDTVRAQYSTGVPQLSGRGPASGARGNVAAWLNVLVLRALRQHWPRTLLSALAVALGTAATVAASVVSKAILNALSRSQDAQSLLIGLLDQFEAVLTLAGAGITFVAGFLVYNAFAMSIAERRRQIGALRALGMTRRQVTRGVLVEALITGGIGTGVGLLAGPLAGHAAITLTDAFLGSGVFVFEAGAVSPASLLLAASLGLGVSVFSVFVPSRRAARISPLAALRQESLEDPGVRGKAWIGGALLIAALGAYLAIAPPGEWVNAPWDALLTATFGFSWLVSLAWITPVLIGVAGRWTRGPLTRLWGATGRLIADHLRRSRGRVTLTVLTLAAALAMIVGMTGFIRFMFDELLLPKVQSSAQLGAWLISAADFAAGMSGYSKVENLALSPDTVAEIEQAMEGRIQTMEWRFAVVPELSMLGSSYFSFLLDPHSLQQAGSSFFTFTEGNWATALPLLQDGCGVLVSPAVASRHRVSPGEPLQVTGADGPVACTVAGIGSPYVGASIISLDADVAFSDTGPIALLIWPAPGEERAALAADLADVVDRLPGVRMGELQDMADMQVEVMDALPALLDTLLLLAFAVAAMGVVNTTVIGVTERRRELALLRAIGATRRQVRAMVVGEAALMGLIGGVLGWVGGAGIAVIVAVTYGGNSWGVSDLDLWPAAWRTVRAASPGGLIGLVVAPLICTAAAWLPARTILRGSARDAVPDEG